MTGKVKFYKTDKKWGFITADDGKDYFCHEKGCIDTIRTGDWVKFEVDNSKEKPSAVKVEVDYNR